MALGVSDGSLQAAFDSFMPHINIHLPDGICEADVLFALLMSMVDMLPQQNKLSQIMNRALKALIQVNYIILHPLHVRIPADLLTVRK